MKKTIEGVCTHIEKVCPYGEADGCYMLVPEIGGFKKNHGIWGQEIFKFKKGKVYRITVTEIGDRSAGLAAEDKNQLRLAKEPDEETSEKKERTP